MKYVLYFLSLCVVLGVAEIGLKLFWLDDIQQKSTPNVGIQMQAHPTRIWSLLPDSEMENFGVQVKVDSLGMREGIDVLQEESRIMILGDSSFFGHGVADSDTLHVQLGKYLGEQGINVDVLCGAVPGYSILQSSIFMDEVGWEQNPTMLIIGNVWSDNNFDHFNDQEWISTLQSPFYLWKQKISRSALWQFLLYSRNQRSKEELGKLARISWVKKPIEVPQRRVSLIDYATVLDALIEKAGQKGIEVVLIQPANRNRLHHRNSKEMWYPYFMVQRIIAEHRKIPIFDVAEILQIFALTPSEAFLDEMHPTGKTNYWLSQSIVNRLILDGWPSKTHIPNVQVGKLPTSKIPKDPYIQVGESVRSVESFE
jgi:hypothetical protein